MQPSAAQLALLASFLGASLALGSSTRNCSETKTATVSCYTCMGRDMENCMTGLVCCKGSCYKLIDKEHDLIAKGCTNDQEEDGSMKRRTLQVPLYFNNGERITGESYFCKDKDYCNSGITLSALTSVAVLLVLALFHH